MTVFQINGQQIHVEENGKPNRQKAILIHGWSSSSYALSPLVGPLSQRFHCLSVDLPGYGQSPRLAERTTIDAYVELLSGLIEQVCDGPVVLVGHSMGGMISLTLALKYPILVERMVLIDPTISGKLSTTINLFISPVTLMERFGLGSLIVSLVEKIFVGVTDRMMRPVSFAERTGITETDYHRLRADARRPGQGKVRAECFFAMQENDLSGKLNKIEVPALVLWGAEDNTVPLRDASIVADEYPLADLRILPKASHWPHFETPEVTRRLVAAYLGLPTLGEQLFSPVSDEELLRVQEVAQFLAHSDLGNGLNAAQRTRLAAQCQIRHYAPYKNIVNVDEAGDELYIIYQGNVEVWSDPENPGEAPQQPQRVATLRPGQITGELAMLDQGLRSADLISSAEGATVLALERNRLLALSEDDAVLGSKLLWNVATAMAQRVRFILWQLQRAQQRARKNAHAAQAEVESSSSKKQPL